MDQDIEVAGPTDRALSKEIETLLAVNPSPAFLVRVRERIGREPAPAAWRIRHLVASAAAAAALLLVVGVTLSWRSVQERPGSQASAGPASPAVEHRSSTAVTPQTDPIVTTPEVHSTTTLPSTAAPRAQLPAVIPQTEIDAVHHLIAAANEGGFRFELASDAVPVAAETYHPGDIVVPLIALPPIAGYEDH
jgi:hypothetical protein